MIDDAVVFRAVERILAVVIGGVCIWLGQRLFLSIPEQKEGEGRVEFPGGVSIYVARIGPGVFFALFGALVVGTSFYRGVEVQTTRHVSNAEATPSAAPNAPHTSTLERLEFRGAGASMVSSEREARGDQRALLRKEFQVLNTIPLWRRHDLPPQDLHRLEASVAQVKLTLMKSMWGDAAEGWGDPVEFERWVNDGARLPPPAALKTAADYYLQGMPSKP
jgi:hypothetical protein